MNFPAMTDNHKIIKVCGMRDSANIRQLSDSKIADWMGLIFYSRSPRFVSAPIHPLPRTLVKIGVFVNPSIDDVMRRVRDFGLNGIQLHGDETPDFIRALKARASKGLYFIKAFKLSSSDDVEKTKAYGESCDYFLFDTPCPQMGGSGRQFNWKLLKSYTGSVPFLLSGGIGPDSIPALADFHHPKWAGIDLNSRFESSPAMKDIPSLTKFCKKFKELYPDE